MRHRRRPGFSLTEPHLPTQLSDKLASGPVRRQSPAGRHLKARRLTQQGAAEPLGVDQSKVSRITRGQFRSVSEAKLLELVAKLGREVKIVVGPVRRRAGKIELQFA